MNDSPAVVKPLSAMFWISRTLAGVDRVKAATSVCERWEK